MPSKAKIQGGLDSWTVLLYICLITFGWFNIFAAVYDIGGTKQMFAFSLNSTRQLIWIATSVLLIIIILALDYRFYDTYAYLFFLAILFLLLFVLVVAKEVNGNRSWIEIGAFKLQPSEFAKLVTALALAKYLSSPLARQNSREHYMFLGAILGLPTLFILLQGDAGSAMVFGAFILVLYREGLFPSWLLFGGILMAILFVLSLAVSNLMFLVIPLLIIALVLILQSQGNPRIITYILIATVGLIFYIFSAKYIFTNVLKKHQKERILVLIDEDVDPYAKDVRYNLKQSLIAIGSGGMAGKGFLEGTQTKLKYVPEQSTDFIFCTIGEEYGWLGSMGLIWAYMLLFARLITLAERQNDKFARIYGYSVASILFFHFAVNISMTVGLFPVVGIPLPYISYGGSSLWAFTILLFIFLKLDAHREQQMVRK
ncbi:MAG: rod shape-determining protein RodA [Bacteroidetes bacterium]|nr:MAG: rod shape-determining protein RodA [Bacteroidota bacterium]